MKDDELSRDVTAAVQLEAARAATEDSFELDAIKKVNEMHKQNQEKETKRESEPSAKSIETPVRAIQP